MKDPCEKSHAEWGLAEFRERFPGLRLTHLPDCALQFEGALSFRAQKEGFQQVEDVYAIRGVVSRGFPLEEANIFEIGGRVSDNYHKFNSKRLCLGSPLRIRVVMEKNPTLVGLVDGLIIPYLYNHSAQEISKEFPVGELDHGAPGLVDDYEKLFQLNGPAQCIKAIQFLGMKKRIANKHRCPCESGRRLGRCHNRQLNVFRRLAPRKYFQDQAIYLTKEQMRYEKALLR